jgi:structural maintenance of chromosome 2
VDAVEKEELIQMKLGGVRADYDEIKEKLTLMEAKWAEGQAELADLKNERATKVKEMDNAKLEAKKLSLQLTRMQKERGEAEKMTKVLEKKYSWVMNEKHAFGIRGGDYDFEATNLEAVTLDLNSMKNEQETLVSLTWLCVIVIRTSYLTPISISPQSKRVNKKVMGMIEKAESEYTELLRKRKVVENDKKKIQAVIQELDVKKKSEVERTWGKVNRDFGSIFSTLLPGARAKLDPPEGMEVWEGLEVKVAFGDVWKESLGELSGGQRSLLALSLILSLLLFKPAPMYILDEVDSALDLSHTQNIGLMLKTHFSQSQFIVVSLKEGMFNNANVIFRTKFVDGVSTVTRTLGTGYSRGNALAGFNSHRPESTDKAVGRGKKKGKENNTLA